MPGLKSGAEISPEALVVYPLNYVVIEAYIAAIPGLISGIKVGRFAACYGSIKSI